LQCSVAANVAQSVQHRTIFFVSRARQKPHLFLKRSLKYGLLWGKILLGIPHISRICILMHLAHQRERIEVCPMFNATDL